MFLVFARQTRVTRGTASPANPASQFHLCPPGSLDAIHSARFAECVILTTAKVKPANGVSTRRELEDGEQKHGSFLPLPFKKFHFLPISTNCFQNRAGMVRGCAGANHQPISGFYERSAKRTVRRPEKAKSETKSWAAGQTLVLSHTDPPGDRPEKICYKSVTKNAGRFPSGEVPLGNRFTIRNAELAENQVALGNSPLGLHPVKC